MCINHLCPFCSFPLLSHIRGGKLYWFCQSCTQEVPYGIYQGESIVKQDQDKNNLTPKYPSTIVRKNINNNQEILWEQNVRHFLTTIQELLEADRIVLYQIDAIGKLRIIAESLISGCSSTISKTKINNFFTAETIDKLSEGKSEFIENLLENLKPESTEIILTSIFSLKSQLAIPIMVRDENRKAFLWGIIAAHTCYKIAKWEEKQIRLSELIAQQIALDIEQEYRNQKLCNIINHDEFTKLATRGYFEDVLVQKWRYCSRSNLTISLIMCEVNFKENWQLINHRENRDTYQERIINVLHESIPNFDNFIAHYRENFFVILLPNCPNIEEMVAEIKEKFFLWQELHQKLELNLGFATVLPYENDLPESLIVAAHHNLNQEKKCHHKFHQIKVIEDNKNKELKFISNEEMLMAYVAYFLSRGKVINTPHHREIKFRAEVYQYYGYDYNFVNFWQKLRQEKDFFDFYLKGDVHNFGEFLLGDYTINSCSRCNLPIPIPVGLALDIPSCNLCKVNQLNREYRMIIFTDKIVADWERLLRINGFKCYVFNEPNALIREYLKFDIDLIFIDREISPNSINIWAEKIHNFEQLKDVPIIALTKQADKLLPWQERELNVMDYILMPLNGDYLADYLGKICRLESGLTGNKLHWFPK